MIRNFGIVLIVLILLVVSSVVEQRAFFEPTEVDRKVLAVRFNGEDQVESFAHYGLEDGQIVNFSNRKTPTRGKELSVLQQLFSNIGKFDAPGTGPGAL